MNEPNPIDMDALAAALDDSTPEPDPDPNLASVKDTVDPALEGDEIADPEPEPQSDPDPEPIDSLQVLGPDGEPVDMSLDEILNDSLHDVEIGGETRQISYEDLRAGYMMQQDYTKKTEDLAREREELGPYAQMVAYAKSDPNFVQYLQQYFVYGADPVMGLTQHKDVSEEQLAALLASDDPEDLQKAKAVATERAALRKHIGNQTQRQQKVDAETRQLYENWKAGEERRAREVIPNYDSVVKGKDNYLKGLGFAAQEIESLADHRLYRVIADALAYRDLQSNKGTSKAQLAGKRKHRQPSKTVSGGRGKSSNSKSTRNQNAYARARESGRTEDWATALEGLLDL